MWKQCDENIAPNKNAIVCDGEKCETYCANLFSNPIEKNKNCPTILNHKKISKENSIFLNKLSCLMYADNIIIFAKSPDVLQKLLDCMNTFCDKWNMTINLDILNKNKKNKKDFFTISTTQ